VSWLRVAAAVIARPSLWGTAVRQMRRTAPGGWWRRAPFLPVPSGDYLSFRLVTQYGDGAHRPDHDDVISYLEWCRRLQPLAR
jgi:hypothetical protein